MILAAMGPIIIVSTAWLHLSALPEWHPTRQVHQMNAQIKEKDPEVVVIGPSIANTNIDVNTLSATLGGPRVAVLGQNAATAAIWYAILKYRVYENKAKPKLILLVATTPLLLSAQLSPEHMVDLTQHFASPDEVLAKKAFSMQGDPRLERALEQRGPLRDAFLKPARHALVGMFFDPQHRSTQGEALTDAAAAEAFHDKLIISGANRLLPVVEGGEEGSNSQRFVTVSESFLSDIAALAKAQGAEVVITLPPTSDHSKGEAGISSTQEQELITEAKRLGVTLLDFRTQAMPSSAFKDRRHMSVSGGVTFSRLVGERIAALGGLSGPLKPALELPQAHRMGEAAPLVPPPEAIRQASPCELRVQWAPLNPFSVEDLFVSGSGAVSPLKVFWGDQILSKAETLPKLRSGCNGSYLYVNRALVLAPLPNQAELQLRWAPELPLSVDWSNIRPNQWWAYPKTGIEWRWNHAWAPAQTPLSVTIRALAVGQGMEAPTLSMNGQSVVLQERANGSHRFEAELDLDAPAEDWVLSLNVPEGAAFLIEELSVFMGDHREDIIAPLPPQSASIFEDTQFAGPPPPLPVHVLQNLKGQAVFNVGRNRLECSPYLATEDDVLLPLYKLVPLLDDVEGDKLKLIASDGSPPLSNGRHYGLQYNPDRDCQAMTWLLPGDHLTATTPRPILRKLQGPVHHIHLQAKTNATEGLDGRLHVRLSHGSEILEDADIPIQSLIEGRSWPVIERGMTADLEAFTLEVQSPSDAPALLLDGNLVGGAF